MGRAARTAAALVVAAGALAGCSGAEPASETLPTTSAQAAPTSDALPPLGPADFPMPPEAREKTPDGAVEFTRYYIALGHHISEGIDDPQPLLNLSRNCEQCQMVAHQYAEDRAADYAYAASTFVFDEYGPALLEGDAADVGFVYSQGPFTVHDTTGAPVAERSAPATGDLQSGALLIWDSTLSTWLVTSLTIG